MLRLIRRLCLRSGVFSVSAVGLAVILFSILASPARGQRVVQQVTDLSRLGFVENGYRDCGLRHVGFDASVSFRAHSRLKRSATAEITVDYGSDFSPQARDAFNRAVQVWEAHISSPTEIRIDARRLENPDSGVLGAAGPSSFWIVEANQERFIAGAALADALIGDDLQPDSVDIVARFNLDRDWHYGSGDAPGSKLDFTTVVLHEIGHGLNFLSLCRPLDDGSGRAQCKFEDDNGNLVAGIFSTYLAEQAGGTQTLLTNETAYPNPSTELNDALTSDQLVYVGDNAEVAAGQGNGPVPPKIYAPVLYQSGSSISHNDEATYPTGSINSLMTPNLAAGETVRLPGPLVCGQLIDIGWPVSTGCSLTDIEIRDLAAVTGAVTARNEGSATLRWTQVGNAAIDEYVIEHQYFDNPFREAERIEAQGSGDYSVTLEELAVGTHRFRLAYVTSEGTLIRGTTSNAITVQAQRPAVAAYPNPFQTSVNVSFILEERQTVEVTVYDALGRRVTRLFKGERPPNDARPVVFRPDRLPRSSGVYFIRVEGENFTRTVKAVRIR